MRTRNTILFSLAVLSFCMGANLQPQDYLFIATHRNPTQVVSDDKVAYVLTEGGVLLYDYRRQQWFDNIAPGLGVSNIAYNPDRNQLLMAARGGAILEYNPVFRRVSASSATFAGVPSGTPPADLVGLQLGNDYTFQTDTRGNTVRDRYNRRVGVNTATIFEYDHLWILTAGHGSFLGSMRRREAAPAWFGLYDSSVSAIYTNGKNVWFGAPNPAGALVRAKTDLTDWRMYAAQQGYDFIDGTIYDMLQWRDYLWIATAKGVVRQDMNSGEFRLFRRMQGSTDIAVYRLYVHQDQLYVATANGVAVIDAPESRFHNSELPINISPVGRDLCSSGQDLWAATSLGLFVLRKDGWKSIKDVTKQDVPEAWAGNVPTVGFKDSVLYWASASRVYQKARGHQAQTMIEVANVFRILFEGDVMYVGFDTGVRAFNLKSHLWADFRLEDGIPGRAVQTFFVKDGLLWIGTDLGVMRIKVGPYLP